MSTESFRQSYLECRAVLVERLTEPAPGRIQLLAGPRQVGKTTLLLELADGLEGEAVYAAADAPEAALPGSWSGSSPGPRRSRPPRAARSCSSTRRTSSTTGRRGSRASGIASGARRPPSTSSPRARRRCTSPPALARASPVGSSGITLTHWSAASLAQVFELEPAEAAELVVRMGSYPGAFPLRGDVPRWSAYVRDAILEPAIGRDILALAAVRRPALLRQVFGVAASSPAQIVSLQKIQGQLQDAGALETIAHYLALLEEAFLVAPLPEVRRRAARGAGRRRPSS